MHRSTAAAIAAAWLLASTARAAPASDIIQFDFGDFHRCSLSAQGAVDCLGSSNHFGQLGVGKREAGTTRPLRAIERGAGKIATGNFFSCALVGDALECWGDIPVPQGDGHVPTTVIAHGVKDVAAGDRHACALLDTGAVQCWGSDFTGESGSGDYQSGQPTPFTVIERGASAIAAGDEQSCAIVDGTVMCWGRTGLEKNPMDVAFGGGRPPLRVLEKGATALAAGGHHACAIVEGALWCWGDNTYGQVGLGVSTAHAGTSKDMPQKSNGTFADGEQTCAASYTGAVVSCRLDHPVRVIERDVHKVVAKGDQTCALVGEALQCWGRNQSGQLGIATGGADVLRPTTAIAHGVGFFATGARTCALVDGAMQCSRACTIENEKQKCPPQAGFDAHDLAFGLSELEARVGVWRGTLGEQAVMACLDRPDGDGANYYYLRHGLGIPLTATGPDGVRWNENSKDAQAAYWTLDPVAGDRLEGHWHSADGQRALPIRLTRVAAPDADGRGCGSVESGPLKIAYNAPRVAALALTTTPWSDGLRQVSALDGNVKMLELTGDEPAMQRFNRAMRDWLRDQITGYYDCLYAAPNGGDYSEELDVEWRAGPWLVLRETYSADCGGAHPNGGIAAYQTWNLERGERIDPWHWIRGAKSPCEASAPCSSGSAPAALAAIVRQRAERSDDDDCAGTDLGFLQLRPSATGLVFGTDFAYAARACNEDVEIPWTQLEPFFSAEGRKAMRSLRNAAATDRTHSSPGKTP